MSEVEQPSSDQGAVYQSLIHEQEQAEWARRARLDDQGIRLQQTSAVAAGVIVPAVGVSEGAVPLAGVILLVTTLVLLLGAFGVGIRVQWLRKYQVVHMRTMDRMLGDHWTDGVVTSRRSVARVRTKVIGSLRIVNEDKAKWVRGGHVVQLLALVTGAAALCFAWLV